MTVIGARPQIIKSAALSRAIRTKFSGQLTEILVHTGQHYANEMSAVFFDELGMPEPDYNLHIGSGSHGKQTASMIVALEEVFLKEQPDAVVVYGDTNSTLATGVAASKLNIPIVHIEAGLRSHNKTMPEEVNRILCDHVSTLLFSPTETGLKNLQKEGFEVSNQPPYSSDFPKIYHCGDIMYDNSMHFATIADKFLPEELENKPYFLATVHRPANTDVKEHLLSIFDAFQALLELYPTHLLVLPLHPRTKKCMETSWDKTKLDVIFNHPRIQLLPPASFLTIVALEKHCDMVLTDSGGLQKEAYYFQKPCVILRPETEWVELVEQGAAIITDWKKDAILEGAQKLWEEKDTLLYPPLFGDGKAAEFIAEEILKYC